MLEITIRGPRAAGKTFAQGVAFDRLRSIGVTVMNGDVRTKNRHGEAIPEVTIRTEISDGDLRWLLTNSQPQHNAILRVAACCIVNEAVEHVAKTLAENKPKPAPAPDAACPGYLVWNPAHGGPRVRHADMTAAVTEAMRLADQYPDNRFYVMAPVQEFIVHEIRTKSPIQISAVGQTYEPELTNFQKIRARIPVEMRHAAFEILDCIMDTRSRGLKPKLLGGPVLELLARENLILVEPYYGQYVTASLTSDGSLVAIAQAVDEIPF